MWTESSKIRGNKVSLPILSSKINRNVDIAHYYLKGARDLCRSLDHMKKQCVVGSTQRQNRCLLRLPILHLPAAYPRIDLASWIKTDPQRFWITGRLSPVYY